MFDWKLNFGFCSIKEASDYRIFICVLVPKYFGVFVLEWRTRRRAIERFRFGLTLLLDVLLGANWLRCSHLQVLQRQKPNSGSLTAPGYCIHFWNTTVHQLYTDLSVQNFAPWVPISFKFLTDIVCVDLFSDHPEITARPQVKTTTEGDNVTLSCNTTGNPVPTISWTINGTPVDRRDNPRISFSERKQQLIITNVSRTDSGEYRCAASNSLGNDTSNTTSLDVQCKWRMLF